MRVVLKESTEVANHLDRLGTTRDQLIELTFTVATELDNLQYLLQNEINDGDPNEEVEDLTNRVIETREVLILLEKTLTPEPLVVGDKQTHGSVWYSL